MAYIYLLIVVASFSFLSSAKAENMVVAKAFEKIKSLNGDWVKKGSEKSGFLISFETMAGDSVVVETWSKNTQRHSLTIYHLDGEDLIATHYCPQGNQPRLKLAKSSTTKDLKFSFMDITNLNDKDGSHQTALVFEFGAQNNTLIRSEVYRSGDQVNQDHMSIVRK